MLICLHSPSSEPIISNMRCGLYEFVLSIPIVLCFSPFSPVPSTLPECIIFSSVSKEGKQSSRRDFLGGSGSLWREQYRGSVFQESQRTLHPGRWWKPLILASPNKCSERLLAKEIRDDKTEAESLKRESMKLRDKTHWKGFKIEYVSNVWQLWI